MGDAAAWLWTPHLLLCCRVVPCTHVGAPRCPGSTSLLAGTWGEAALLYGAPLSSYAGVVVQVAQ
jgi:hypothetical protein